MALIDDVKTYLRITSTAYNTEIADLILAAKADLDLGGIYTTSESDALYKSAVCTYCKANFGYDNKDADRLERAYEIAKQKMMLALEHSYYAVTFNTGELTYVELDGITKRTDEDGTVILYCRAGNRVPYSIGGGVTCYVDITGDTTVTIS